MERVQLSRTAWSHAAVLAIQQGQCTALCMLQSGRGSANRS